MDDGPRNVLGGALETCSRRPMTHALDMAS
jgi:uncharacterized protein (DUF2237 family)